MAAASFIEEHVICSACSQVYEDPHFLPPCLHTYCLKCVKRLEVWGQVQCPDCGKVTKMEDIKKDFQVQGFVDLHNNWNFTRTRVGMCACKKLNYSHQVGPVLPYSLIHKNTITLTRFAELKYFPWNISIIGEQLWCVGDDDCLNVFNWNCEHKKTIKLDQIKCPESVAETNSQYLIVACSKDNGLHLIQNNGEYHSKITDGSFSSAVCYNGDVFALDYKACQVIVFRRNGNKWREVKSFQLEHFNGSPWDRLVVQGSGIYVSSWHNHCIDVYCIHGQFLFQRGKKGSDGPGQLVHPILCSVDSAGSILVADWGNHRLQVCDSSGQWTVVKFPRERKYPAGAVVSGVEGEMWIVSLLPTRILNYRISA